MEVIFIPAKTYGYAKNCTDVDALHAYSSVDLILENRPERGQYRMFRRYRQRINKENGRNGSLR